MKPQLPLVLEAASIGSPHLTRRQRQLPTHTWAALHAQATEHRVTLRMVLLAAFARVIADWSREPRFTLDLAGDGPLVIDMPPGCGILDLARLLTQTVAPAEHPLVATADTWLIHEVGDDSTLIWDTADKLYPDQMPDDLITTHVALLQALAADPRAWQAPVPELLPPRQAQARSQVNDTQVPLERALLHDMFWRQAARTPEAIAVYGKRPVTYRELRAGAAWLASRVRPHRMVAVVMDKGWEQVLAVLGILAADAAYIPIAPDTPPERMRHLLRHAEITLVVTQPGLAQDLPVARLDVDDTCLTAPDIPVSWANRLSDLAYVIYTSGSTGQPKGVMIDHGAAANTIQDINRRFHVGPSDRVYALSSLGFDLSVYDIFGPLAVGAGIVMPQPGTARAPWEWAEDLQQHQVSVWNSVPALMEMLVEYTAGRRMRLPESLRLVLMSGDWIPVTLPDRIRALATPGIDLIGMGGATEASIWSNFYPITTVDPGWPSIPYGKPLANQHFEVLDQDLRRRPDWVPGELYIGGSGVAMGYLNDPARTAASFLIHPVTGQRLYRTGDLGRYLGDGNLEFLGREDFQVKINGFRVELGEIEATLLAHPAVTGAVVVASGAAQSDRRLHAFVTPADAPTGQLLEHLRTSLPPYLVPDRITAVDQFPLSGNGKVDRQALLSGGLTT